MTRLEAKDKHKGCNTLQPYMDMIIDEIYDDIESIVDDCAGDDVDNKEFFEKISEMVKETK
jgi:hypothetical protein